MSEPRTLTLQDINNSETLRKLGAMAGDEVLNNELIRKYSSEEDAVTEGKILTAEDVINSPTLQGLGATEGDRVYNGELYKTNEDDAWTQFRYAVTKTGNFITDIGDILEAYMPMSTGGGRLTSEYGVPYVPKEEKYSKEFLEGTYDERIEKLTRKKERDLQEEFGQFFKEDEDSKAATAGAITKVLADPIALAIPFGGTVKTAMGLGGVYSLASTSATDLATEREFDPQRTAINTSVAMLTSGLLRKGVDIVGSKSSNRLIDNTQARVFELTAEGKTVDETMTQIVEEGLNPVKLTAAINNTGRKLRFPANADSAHRALENSIVNDSAVSRIYSKSLDRWLGALSTRVRNISEPVFGRLRRFEFNIHKNTQELADSVDSFLSPFSLMGKALKRDIARHLYNGNFNSAKGLMPEEIRTAFTDSVEPLLSKIGDELIDTGHTFTKIDNYFPRLVKDLEGLRKSLGVKERGVFERALDAYAKSKGTTVSKLTPQEKSAVLDLQIRGYGIKIDGGKPRFAKERQIENLTPKQLKYYASPEESLSMYIRGAVNDIQKRKFMGRNAQYDKSGLIDYDASVGAIVRKEVDEGNIPAARQEELEELLRARFIGGDQSPHVANSTLRDIGYLGTIANPISAITQLGDLGVSGSLKGFRNTIASMFGEKNVKLIDIGMENAVAKELTHGDIRKTAKALNKALGLAGFKRVDRLTKETHINASLKKARQMVKTEQGEAKFRQEFSKIYGDEIDALVADLKTGNISENVKFHLFNELSDIQPISLSEMPETYLTRPNGRIMYSLKSFTLKQYDIVRRQIVQEYKKGNKMNAIKRATLYAGYVTAANTGTQAVKDMILGREVRPDDIPERSLWALLGVFGFNKYLSERYLQQGDVKGAVANVVLPATTLIESTFELGATAFEDEPNYPEAMKGIPVVGTLFYNWFGGGAERFNERLDD